MLRESLQRQRLLGLVDGAASEHIEGMTRHAEFGVTFFIVVGAC